MIKTYARGTDLALAGELRGWTQLEVTLRWGQVGSWSLTGPAKGLLPELLTPGTGLVIVDTRGVPLLSDVGVLISGDVEEVGPRVWSADGSDSDPGTLTVSGGDDLAIVADELAWPDPTNTIANQTAAAYDARSGVAETVIKAYVAANVGVGRDADRGDASAPDARLVTVTSDLTRGSSVSYKARFDPLLDVVRTLGQASTTKLFPRVVQAGADLEFDVYTTTDRSGSVIFSRARRNLRGYSLQRAAPTVTHVVVAGSGEGTARIFRERKDSTAANTWRRMVRTFVDQRQTNVTAELDAAGDEELARGRQSGALSATAVDTPQLRLGADYSLGDTVTVEIEPGVSFTDQVTAAKLVVDEQGVHPWEITIGNPDIDAQAPDLLARVARLDAQLSALQRRI